MLSVQGVDAILGGVVQSVAAANVSSGSLTGKNLPVGQSELDKAKVSHNFFFEKKRLLLPGSKPFLGQRLWGRSCRDLWLQLQIVREKAIGPALSCPRLGVHKKFGCLVKHL
jgi:hypothetical protein